MHKSILLITDKKKTYMGTGFVIDKDDDGVFVVTCGHVINNRDKTLLVDGKKPKIIKNEYENGLDLAILYVKGLDIEPLEVSDDKSAENVQVIGYSKLSGVPKREPINDISIKHGIEFSGDKDVNSIKLYPKESISSGYSGSPVICQESNKVIGVVNIQVGGETNYAICAKHIFDIYSIPDTSVINKPSGLSAKKGLVTKVNNYDFDIIKEQFNKNLNGALKSFSTQQRIWVEPRLHSKEEDLNSSTDNDTKVDLNSIVADPRYLVIRARQQFGLTCLAHYFIKEAWVNEKPSFWLYIDSNELNPHAKEIVKYVTKKLQLLSLSKDDIECIVLDEYSSNIKDADKIINLLCEEFSGVPVIVMMTLVENPLLNESIDFPVNREFEILNLWALPRNGVRKVISEYNNGKYIGDENAVVAKVVSDLEVLNIPRTALNCLTMLKIYEVEFDDSPVNRTEMIRRVLFLLFTIDEIPRYKNRPDLKDTEYILGYFCELIIKEKKCYFSRDDFLSTLNDFCKNNEIDIDTHVIFDVLFANNIIVLRGQKFCFKFNYWVFYFAAHRMHHNSDFANYVLQDMRYTSFPELIEFYTGIDRRRDDALNVLINDLKCTSKIVDDKCGLPQDFNIYGLAQWQPSEDSVEKMHSEVSDGVLSSNLPDIVKDQYADQSYDRTRPLTQSIHSILEEYSLLRLMKNVKAGSMALRNSDYANTETRHELLQGIIYGWETIIKVLIVLAPILSKEGRVTLEGASFILSDNFKGTHEEKFNALIQMIPTNVVGWYKNDLYSKKMGTLLFNHVKNEKSGLIKHTLNLLIISKRPKGWDKYIENYIVSEDKNSFYLGDIYKTLRAEYKYSFVSSNTLGVLANLIKMAASKHQFGIKKPSVNKLDKISKTQEYDLPERDVDLT